VIRVQAGSISLTAESLRGLSYIEAEETVAAMGEVLHVEIRENLSLTDHTLQDLADLDHPYARRHGAIQTGVLGHEPEWLVHKQSGELLGALQHGPLGVGENYGVWLDPTIAPHAEYVIEGTKTMLPRDTLWSTAGDSRVQKEMMRAAARTLGRTLRTKALLRFGKVR